MPLSLYEFPLCEKVRNYLRLETLIKQLQVAKTEPQYLDFLSTLFDIMELINRLDFRTDFLRDLDAYKKSLAHWSSHPGVDQNALQDTLTSISQVSQMLVQSKSLTNQLRNDKFLNSIKQRFEVLGGATQFDIPVLYCWLETPADNKLAHMNKWYEQLHVVVQSLSLILSLLRQKSAFKDIHCDNGFYQSTSEVKIELLRVKYDNTDNIFPVVSGSRNRFGIRFMAFNGINESNTPHASSMTFSLACC